MSDNVLQSILMTNEVTTESLVLLIQKGLITKDDLKSTLNESWGNITNRQVPQVRDSKDFGHNLWQCVNSTMNIVNDEIEKRSNENKSTSLTVTIDGAIQ